MIPYLSESEWLFWGGIGVMAGAAIMTILCIVIFSLTGRRLKRSWNKNMETTAINKDILEIYLRN